MGEELDDGRSCVYMCVLFAVVHYARVLGSPQLLIYTNNITIIVVEIIMRLYNNISGLR